MHHLILVLLFLWLPTGFLSAQSYSAMQYTPKDGLASPTVYNMLQSKDGFMWFATEAGLCRFDGTHFKTFTTAEGLPDNEILKMYEDSQGRIWLLPFKNSICYYRDGKIYNQENDSMLKKVSIEERLFNVFEDSAGTIWFNEQNNAYKIYKNNKVERLESLGGVKFRSSYFFGIDKHNRVWFLSVTKEGRWIIYKNEKGQSLPTLENYGLSGPNDFLISSAGTVWRESPRSYVVVSDHYPSKKQLPWQEFLFANTFSFVNDSILSINSIEGVRLYNMRSEQPGPLLLKGRSVSGVVQDSEKNWWISTLGDGVYRIPSQNFRNLDLEEMESSPGDITSAAMLDSVLYVIASNSRLLWINLARLNLLNTKQLYARPGRLFDVLRKNGEYVLISASGFFRYDSAFRFIGEYRPGIFTKAEIKVDNLLYVSTNVNVMRFDMDKFRSAGIVWEGRSTAVLVKGETVYIGTLHGLYTVTGDQPPLDLGKIDPLFKNRISTLSESADGSIWVGTTEEGLIRLKNGKIIQRYTVANGLSSNICRTILMDGNTIWLGTNKGLNKITIGDQPGKVIKITYSDGLGSDQVNKIMTYGDTLFVNTSEGITWFNKSKLDQFSECKLNVLDVSGITSGLLVDRVYKVNNKSLKISYVGISYKSTGDIIYKYRLVGADTGWKTTNETTLEFVSLPYGRYDLELIAENKFGVLSNTVTIRLDIPIPFWKTVQFYFFSALVFLGLVYWLYKRRLKTIKKREREKTALNKKLVEMELKALRAQMNPHFTFNVLNSIQYYIAYHDTDAAQNYLAKFSKLIRRTLDNSKHTFIKLEEETAILKLYLDLEKMRNEDRFEYDIIMDEGIDAATLIPNMLIQPFVENAIKHGFRERVEKPKVQISITDHSDGIRCRITDNGIGRDNTGKPVAPNGHKPAGVAMVMDKAEALKYHYNYKVEIEVIDLHTPDNIPCGTSVIIKIPKQTIVP